MKTLLGYRIYNTYGQVLAVTVGGIWIGDRSYWTFAAPDYGLSTIHTHF
jgi:hypothetical protein